MPIKKTTIKRIKLGELSTKSIKRFKGNENRANISNGESTVNNGGPSSPISSTGFQNNTPIENNRAFPVEVDILSEHSETNNGNLSNMPNLSINRQYDEVSPVRPNDNGSSNGSVGVSNYDNIKPPTTVAPNLSQRHRNWHFSLSYKQYSQNVERYQQLFGGDAGHSFIMGQEELSSSGYRHLQIYCEFPNAVFFNTVRDRFMIKFVTPVAEQDKELIKNYVQKEETRVPNGIKILNGKPSKTKSIKNNLWYNLLTCSDYKSSIELLKNKDPFTYLTKKKCLVENLKNEYGNITDIKHTNFKIPFYDVYDDRTHLFIGPSGIGKTSFALAHFLNPCLVTAKQSFNLISERNSGIVIDDMDFRKWSCTDLIHLVDCAYDCFVDVKYSTACIPSRMPRIICLNSLSYFYPHDLENSLKEAIDRRCYIHTFTDKLYHLTDYIPIQQSKLTNPYRDQMKIVAKRMKKKDTLEETLDLIVQNAITK